MERALLTIIILYFYFPNYGQTLVDGRINDLDGWKPMLYLSFLERYNDIFSGYDGLVIDSAAIAPDGYFAFQPTRYRKGFYRLNIQPSGAHIMAGLNVGVPFENYIHFYINPTDKHLQISARASGLTRSARISGNPDNALFGHIRDIRQPLLVAVDSNWTVLKTAEQLTAEQQTEIRKQVTDRIVAAARSMQRVLANFIDTTTNLQAGILATTYYNLGDDFAQYAPYFDSMIRKWSSWDLNNPYLAGLKQNVDEFNLFIPIGSVAPDVRLPGVEGDTISLSETKASLILLDFWASWCAPCRLENKTTVLPAYKRFKDKGFEVFSVSFDTNRQKWLQAIEKDKYTWIQVVDLVGAKSSKTGRMYKIVNIPTTYLLDKNGVVLAKNLQGNQLTAFIESFFSAAK